MEKQRKFKFSGRIEPNSLLHSTMAEAPDGALIPPAYAPTQWPQNSPVPQYAPTVNGVFTGYNPPGDCDGYYMSNKFQPNNNCYAYATLICPNTFPQPGRNSPGSIPFYQAFTAEIVMKNAVLDGLQFVGTSLQDIQAHQAQKKSAGQITGHYVALMFSEPESNIGGDPNANWPGDYHWARCDDNVNFSSWSQKDGNDQVTNFDFAGQPITNPATANWRVNQGPIGGPQKDNDEYVVSYDFYCYMFVPQNGVNII